MTKPVTEKETIDVVRLRRGAMARLIGDGRIGGWLLPSQMILALLARALSPFGLVDFLLLAPAVALAFAAVFWSATIRGTDLVCTVAGIRVLVIDLERSQGAVVDKHTLRYDVGHWLVVVRSPYVSYRVLDKYRRPIKGDLMFGQTSGMTRHRSDTWAHAITVGSGKRR